MTTAISFYCLSFLLATTCALPTSNSGKSCVAIKKSQCGGTDKKTFSCLRCGTKSDYDCEECCPGCTSVSKGDYKWCECKGPAPGPSPPPPSGDTWNNYQIGELPVLSVVGGRNATNYEKVLIMLHGGGGSGNDWRTSYDYGWFGDISGLKLVFPSSPDRLWYHSYKNGCGLLDDCAYDLPSITAKANMVEALIEHEKKLVGGDGKAVYLAGFSQGGQLTSYMQLAKLNYALGGAIVMDGFPLPPLVDMPNHAPAAAKKNSTYTGTDMKFMLYWGADDYIFPAALSHETFNGIFKVLGIESTLKVNHTEPGMGHNIIQKEFKQVIQFVRGSF